MLFTGGFVGYIVWSDGWQEYLLRNQGHGIGQQNHKTQQSGMTSADITQYYGSAAVLFESYRSIESSVQFIAWCHDRKSL